MNRFICWPKLLILLLVTFAVLPWVVAIHAYGQDTPTDASSLRREWRNTQDPAQRKERAERLVETAFFADNPSLVEEVARDGTPHRMITSFPKAAVVPLKPIYYFKTVDASTYPNSPVLRRISADRIELWTATEGWLFDHKGGLKNHVTVRRHDGQGREWFGAFLPDGRWITTDIWEMDKTLTAFSAKGKWQWERHTDQILLSKPDETVVGLIGWARSDREGKGWIVSVGSEQGRGVVWIDANAPERIRTEVDPWKLAYPRALGPRGFYCQLTVPSDDFQTHLTRSASFHGYTGSYPAFAIGNREVRLPSSGRFGFWPQSKQVFVEGDNLPDGFKTWFFDPTGRYETEIMGRVLGDAANGRDLLFQLKDNSVVALDSGYHVAGVRQFATTTASTTPLKALEIYDDLRLGFFVTATGELLLAGW